MKVRDLLFSYRGRIGRWAYFAATILGNALLLPQWVLRPRGGGVTNGAILAYDLVWLLLTPPALWIVTAAMVKRGHDRNRPAVFSFVVLGVWEVLVSFAIRSPSPLMIGAAGLVALYVLVEFQFLPASPKASRYDLRLSAANAADVFS